MAAGGGSGASRDASMPEESLLEPPIAGSHLRSIPIVIIVMVITLIAMGIIILLWTPGFVL
jgi:hypothetical protein